jgi:inner membrane protein
MTSPTHITFAEFIYLLLLTTAGVALSPTNALFVAFSSTLPDIDTAASYPGKVIPFLSRRIERRFGHRTLTHSVVFIVAIAIVLIPVWLLSSDTYVCCLMGYSSHPFLDTMTVHGVKLFYPFSGSKCVFPLEVNNPHRYRLQTGSKMDRTLGIFFLLGCIPVFLIANQGYERFIRSTQRNIESAVRDFNEFSKDNLVFAKTTAYNMLTKQPFSGKVEIVGALNPSTLVFKGIDGDLHTLGKTFEADYVAEDIICEKGAPAHSTIRNFDLSNQLLYQIASYIDTSLENYFFGDLTTSDKVSLPENIRIFSSITGGGGSIKFNYARYHDIHAFNLEYAFITKGILTIKSIHPETDLAATSTASLPRFEDYAQIPFTLDAKESIAFFKAKGDTIRERELVAKRDLAQFFQGQISLNEEKVRALETQKEAFIADISQKITNAEQMVRIDSTEHAQKLDLSKGGFMPPQVLEASFLSWQKSRTALSQLIASKSRTTSKLTLDVRKLQLANQHLGSRARAAEKQSEIRSTVNGILVDIRQVPHNNKTQVTLIIKRTPSPPH